MRLNLSGVEVTEELVFEDLIRISDKAGKILTLTQEEANQILTILKRDNPGFIGDFSLTKLEFSWPHITWITDDYLGDLIKTERGFTMRGFLIDSKEIHLFIFKLKQ